METILWVSTAAYISVMIITNLPMLIKVPLTVFTFIIKIIIWIIFLYLLLYYNNSYELYNNYGFYYESFIAATIIAGFTSIPGQVFMDIIHKPLYRESYDKCFGFFVIVDILLTICGIIMLRNYWFLMS